jgi:hypothetical protein
VARRYGTLTAAAAAPAAAGTESAGSEVASGAAPGTTGAQMTPSASPGSDDRVELGGAPLGPAEDGSHANVTPPVAPDGGMGDVEEEAGQEPPRRRQLRPRNAAGGVMHPPKPEPDRVFRKGGGRK